MVYNYYNRYQWHHFKYLIQKRWYQVILNTNCWLHDSNKNIHCLIHCTDALQACFELSWLRCSVTQWPKFLLFSPVASTSLYRMLLLIKTLPNSLNPVMALGFKDTALECVCCSYPEALSQSRFPQSLQWHRPPPTEGRPGSWPAHSRRACLQNVCCLITDRRPPGRPETQTSVRASVNPHKQD